MSDRIIPVGEGFWNIRGSFSVGPIPIGTQSSLARLDDGRFVLLDAYTLSDELLGRVRDLTSGGRDIDAILNLHPFHTVHVERVHRQFPEARLFGTARHVEVCSSLPWQDLRTEDPALHEAFSNGLEFSVPEGVDFVHTDPKLHFSSVLAYHPASQTIHVDDTFNYLKVPVLGGVGVRLHPTLRRVLQPRMAAAAEFRGWVQGIAERWGGARNLCAAHNAALLDDDRIRERLLRALRRVEGTLSAHASVHG